MASTSGIDTSQRMLYQWHTLEEMDEGLDQINGCLEQEGYEFDLDAIAKEISKQRINLPLISNTSSYRDYRTLKYVVLPTKGPSVQEVQRAELYLKVAKKFKQISDKADSLHSKNFFSKLCNGFRECYTGSDGLEDKRSHILRDAKHEKWNLVRHTSSENYSDC